MTFGLGVDLGTTFTAAAVSRGAQPEMVPLGDRSAAIPSVVMIRENGTSIVGDAAQRQATAHPARVAREVKRRLGDPTPLILGGEPHSAAQILSRLLRAAVDAAAAREGRRPDGIVLTHPANWGPYKRELFDSVPRLADLTAVSMLTEPEAAAAHYASNERVVTGSVVAVYDLGGGTFDATVLRQRDDGFEFLGPPEGIEGLGGIDFDEAVFAHVDRSLDGALSALDLDDPRAAASLVRVRQDCVLAKEALSGDTETSIPVMLPDLLTEVRLTRGEFEEMIRAPIEATVSALRRALGRCERRSGGPEQRAARRRVLPHPARLADAVRRARSSDGRRHPPQARGGAGCGPAGRAPADRRTAAGRPRARDATPATRRPTGGPAGRGGPDRVSWRRASPGTGSADTCRRAGRLPQRRHSRVEAHRPAHPGAGDGLLRPAPGGRSAGARSAGDAPAAGRRPDRAPTVGAAPWDAARRRGRAATRGPRRARTPGGREILGGRQCPAVAGVVVRRGGRDPASSNPCGRALRGGRRGAGRRRRRHRRGAHRSLRRSDGPASVGLRERADADAAGRGPPVAAARTTPTGSSGQPPRAWTLTA